MAPAESHPGVVVAAVAARDSAKASKYAKDHGIAKSYGGQDAYQSKMLCLVDLLPRSLSPAVRAAIHSGLQFPHS